MNEVGPCEGPTLGLQYLIVVLGAINTAFAAWLVNRRARADRRDNGRNDGPLDQATIDARKRKDPHRR